MGDEFCEDMLDGVPDTDREMVLDDEMMKRVDSSLQAFFDCVPANRTVVVELKSFDTGKELTLDRPVSIVPGNEHVSVHCPDEGAEGGIRIRWSRGKW